MRLTADGGVALYHVVKGDEGFDDAARMLLGIVQTAAREHPGKPRHLFLDIEGHRNQAGGWDQEMYELQADFLTGFLGQWLTSIPSLHGGDRLRRDGQREDVPTELTIQRT
jgi:hypothetical protein